MTHLSGDWGCLWGRWQYHVVTVDGLPHLDIDLCSAFYLFSLIFKNEICGPFLSAPQSQKTKKSEQTLINQNIIF